MEPEGLLKKAVGTEIFQIQKGRFSLKRLAQGACARRGGKVGRGEQCADSARTHERKGKVKKEIKQVALWRKIGAPQRVVAQTVKKRAVVFLPDIRRIGKQCVKAVLRRFQPAQTQAPKNTGKYVEYPDLVINLTNYSVVYNGNTIDMPPKELELLYFLASSPNQVFTREQLLDHIWGYEYIGDTRTVDVHIKRLREKIKDHANWAISTVWGIGYKFEVKS